MPGRALRDPGGRPTQVAFEPEKLPTVGVAPAAQLSSWEGDLLVLAVPEEDFATEGERQGGRRGGQGMRGGHLGLRAAGWGRGPGG